MAGIDVGKSRLDASVGGGGVRSFTNDEEGIAAALEWLAEQGVGLVVCEPTGGYEEPLVRSLRQARIPVHPAHPNKVRAFAQASGRLAKTGRLDAQVLSNYGRVFASEEVSQPEPEWEEVQALLRRRRQLVDQRVQELNRLDRAWNPAVRASAHLLMRASSPGIRSEGRSSGPGVSYSRTAQPDLTSTGSSNDGRLAPGPATQTGHSAQHLQHTNDRFRALDRPLELDGFRAPGTTAA